MTREQSEEVMEHAVRLGNQILSTLYKVSTPDVAITALASVSAAVLCNLTPEDGVTPVDMMENWFDVVRHEQDRMYKEMIEAEKTAH